MPKELDAQILSEPVWQESFDIALAEAARQERPVLLRFTAAWCVPCQVMDTKVWPDDKVQTALAQHVIPVELDIDNEDSAEVARRYGVAGIPTLLLVDARGDELARGGFMGVDALAEFLAGSDDAAN